MTDTSKAAVEAMIERLENRPAYTPNDLKIDDNAVAMLRALQEEREWRPIESAPKDGTDFVVYCGPMGDPMYGVAYWSSAVNHAYRTGSPGEDESGWMMWWQNDLSKHKWPTQWLPLPQPPAEEQEG